MDTCSCGTAAAGYCQLCHGMFCGPCYPTHTCVSPSNVQCSVCFEAPATFMCLCEFPCPVTCEGCAGKHAASNPTHMLVPSQYRPVISTRDAFVRMKARQLSMHQLEADLKDTVYYVGEAKRNIDEQVAGVLERLTKFRDTQVGKLEELQKQLEGYSEAMQTSYFSLLFEPEGCPEGQEHVLPLRDFLQKQYVKMPKPLVFSSDFSSLNADPQVLLACPLVDLLSGEPSSPTKVCSYCQNSFIPAGTKSSLEEDFCSVSCFGHFQALLVSTSGGLAVCRYCGLEFPEEAEGSVRLPCKKHAYHSKDCFIRYLLKRSRCFKNGMLFACEVCSIVVQDKFAMSQFPGEGCYSKFQSDYRDLVCIQCQAPAEVLTDCNHCLCEDCGQVRSQRNWSLCAYCGIESFPDCEMCELNGTVQLSCRHFLCSQCFSTDTCPICCTPATITQHAPPRTV